MSKEPETLNLYQKLLEIQKKVNGLAKDKKAYGYSYVTGDKVLDHIKPMMNDLGLLLKPEVLSIDNVRQDYKVKSGDKSEILSKVLMRFTWIDCATGEKDENLFGANGQNDWDKGVGSALTYAERYFLLKFFHIATDEDDIDNPERKEPAPKQAPPKEEPKQEAPATGPVEPATVRQKTELLLLLNNKAVTNEEKNKMLENINNLDAERIEKAIQKIKKVIADRQKGKEAVNA
jgi:hypothetical protein